MQIIFITYKELQTIFRMSKVGFMIKTDNLFPLNKYNHNITYRKTDKYKEIASTERNKQLAITFIQNLLNSNILKGHFPV